MATTIILSIIEAPLTIDHVIDALGNTSGSGFCFNHHVDALWDRHHDAGTEPTEADITAARAMDAAVETRRSAALAAIAANEAVIAVGRADDERRGDTTGYAARVAATSGSFAIALLASRMTLGESPAFDEGNPLWQNTQKALLVDWNLIDDLVKAVRRARASENPARTDEIGAHEADRVVEPEALRAFLVPHVGKLAVVVGE